MLSTQNSGKYYSESWIEERNKAAKDKTGYTQAELDHLDITGDLGTQKYRDKTYKIDTVPADPETQPKRKKIDIRELPQMGGK